MTTWAERIRDLQASGMTLNQIGLAIGLSTGAVGDIANGRTASPRGDAAMRLHALHLERCSPAGEAA